MEDHPLVFRLEYTYCNHLPMGARSRYTLNDFSLRGAKSRW